MTYEIDHHVQGSSSEGLRLDEQAANAHLLIHSGSETGGRGHHGDTPLQRLLALYSDGPMHERASLNLEIQDLGGQMRLAIRDADPLVDVTLSPGTYHVTAAIGEVRRGYTMTLKQNESFDLYLRLQQRGQ